MFFWLRVNLDLTGIVFLQKLVGVSDASCASTPPDCSHQ
jgi:hypothetical protein